MNKSEKLGTQNIKRLLITMSIPAMISSIVQALYNIVDSVFVARINEKALTALSLAFPLQVIITAICLGIGVGLSSVISRRLGEGNRDEAINSAEHGFMIGFVLWIILVMFALFVPRWFFSFFSNDPVIIDYATSYITLILLFSFGVLFSQICMSILQSTGDMISAMKIQLTGAIINIVLDPLLIFGVFFIPAIGFKGAAIATVIAQMCSLILGLSLLSKSEIGKNLNLKKFHFDKMITGNIIKVGFPSMIMQGIGSVMIAGINLILVTFGPTSIAVFGAYFKLQTFGFMPVIGMTQGLIPIIGYNFGAKNKQRIIDVLKFAVKISISIMVTVMIVFHLFPKQLLTLFNSSENMMEMGIPAFRILSLIYPIAAIAVIAQATFQALGDAYVSTIMSFTRQIIVILPVAWLLSLSLNEIGVWWAYPISEIANGIIIIIFGIKIYNKKIKNLGIDSL